MLFEWAHCHRGFLIFKLGQLHCTVSVSSSLSKCQVIRGGKLRINFYFKVFATKKKKRNTDPAVGKVREPV